MAKQFENKVALVTGGASGIGLATALAFARAGAKVAVADVQEGEEKRVGQAIRELGGQYLLHACDVSQPLQVQGLIARVVETFGGLDFAVNNAGISGQPTPAADLEESDWDRVMDINLKGAWLCMKHEIPALRHRGRGAIVNVSSIAGLVGFPGAAHYVASKHGLIGLTKSAALDYAKEGIRINAVCPGVIKTPMVDRYTGGDSAKEAGFAAGAPVGRLGKPEEIAGVILFLCSPAASYVTGQALAADGGWVAQ